MKEDFKIIAIRPLEKCNPDYSKVLKRGELYTFYNEYKIDVVSDTITYNESVPANLYDVNNIKINISAIVGKNGEGKSTLVELLFMAINNISHKAKNVKPAKIKTIQLNYVRKLHVELYFELDGLYKFQINDVNLKIFKYSKVFNRFEQPIEVAFESYKLNHFFYTIGTNYSHYALNSKDYNIPWVHNLFHKNDAYQAPIVINPFRKEGNIDINNENFLVKSRLLSLLISPDIDNSYLTEKQKATEIEFKFNRKKFDYVYKLYRKDKEFKIEESEFKRKNKYYNKYEVVNSLFKKFGFEYSRLRDVTISNAEISIIKYTEDYIFKKLINISLTYDHYSLFFNKETEEFCGLNSNNIFSNNILDLYIKRIFKDKSHITLKLRQAIHFIVFETYKDFETIIVQKRLSCKINYLTDNIQTKAQKYKKETIELLPPSFLEPDIKLEVVNSESESDEIVMFSSLSSGEKQLIYTVSSIIYHLKNLISVDDVNNKLVRYTNFNLVFEEIELYFHPDLQRKFINHLLKNLEKLPNDKIDAINVCFVTHSPFILSDIPCQNIIFLKLDKDENKSYQELDSIKTFGANIHDLLKHNFFLTDGLIGEFAKNQIKRVLCYVDPDNKCNDTYCSEESVLKIIKLIGEPLIKDRLLSLFNDKFTSKIELEKDEEIMKLKKEILELKNAR